MSTRGGVWLIMLMVIGVGAVSSIASAQNDRSTPEQPRQVLEENRPLAENGDASAQYNMGVLYDRGYGVEQDYGQARQWYEKAAAQHYGRAEHNLGIMYESGKGMPRDVARAAHWFRRGADDGQAASQNNLAVLYMKGEGVPQNTGKAAFWMARAAAAGNSAAIENLPRVVSDLPHIHVNADDVNVRDQPNRQARIVSHIDSDQIVIALARRQDWTQILLPSRYTTGWVANFLLSDSQAPLASDDETPTSAPPSEVSDGDTSSVAPKDTASSSTGQSQNKATPKSVSTSSQQSTAAGQTPPAETPPTADRSSPSITPVIVRSRVMPPKRPSNAEPESETPTSVASSTETGQDRSADTDADSTPAANTVSRNDADSTPEATARVGVSVANLRARAEGNASIVGQLRRGDSVRLLDEHNGWRYIETSDGDRAWIAGYLLIKP